MKRPLSKPRPHLPTSFHLLQVEARLRQLEGRAPASAGLKARAQPTKYDAARPDGGALASRPAGYDDAGDVTTPKKDKKDKKDKDKKDKKRKADETPEEKAARKAAKKAAKKGK